MITRTLLAATILATCAAALGAQTTYTVTPHLNQGANPGGINTESDTLTSGWTDIHPTITSPTANEWSTPQTIPFPFSFYGNPVTQYRVSLNGLLTFDTTSTLLPSANDNLPSAALPDNTVCVFWDEFTASPPILSDDDVDIKVFGTAPNRQLWVRWYSFEYGNPALSFSYFSCVLEETTNKVYVVENAYYSGGNVTSTVGVQLNSTTATQFGTNALAYSAATSSAISNNGWYDFTPIPLVVQLEVTPAPVSGLTTVGDNDRVVGAFDLFARHTSAQAVSSLTLTHTGTVSAASIADLKLWHDQDGDSVLDTGEPQLGSTVAGLTGGAVTFTGAPLINLGSNAGGRVLITVDVLAGAVGNQTVKFEVGNAAAVSTVPGPVAGTFPVASDPILVVQYTAVLPFSEGFEATLAQNARFVTEAGMYPSTTAVGAAVTLGSRTGNSQLVQAGTTVGTDPRTGTQMADMSFPNGLAAAAIDFHFDLSAYNTATHHLEFTFWWNDSGMDVVAADVAFDYAFISVDGGTTWLTAIAKMDPALSVATGGGPWVRARVGLTPALIAASANYSNRTILRIQASENLATDHLMIDDVSLAVSAGTLEIAPLPGAGSQYLGVSAPQTDFLVGSADIEALGPGTDITSVTVRKTGTIADTDVTEVKMWRDNGDGVFNAASDTQLGATAAGFVSGAATFTGAPLQTVATYTPVRVFITYSVAASLAPQTSFGVRLASASDIVLSPVVPIAAPFPIEGPQSRIFGAVSTLPWSESFDGQPAGNLRIVAGAGTYPNCSVAGPTVGSTVITATTLGQFQVGGQFDVYTPHSGANQVGLDWPNGLATLGVEFHFDLSAFNAATSRITFEFAWANEADDVGTQDAVFLSLDGGSTWVYALYKFPFNGSNIPYSVQSFNLSQILAGQSLNFTSQVVIRVQGSDNVAFSGSDGFLLDSFRLYNAPDIDLQRPLNTTINNAGNTSLAPTIYPVGTPSQATFYIANQTGGGPLAISGTPATTALSGLTSVNAGAPGSLNVSPGGNTSFDVSFTPTGGPFSFTITVTSDAPVDGVYTITVNGTANSAPTITVTTSTGPVVHNGTVNVGFNTNLAALAVQITVDDVDAGQASLTASIGNTTTQGFTQAEWESVTAAVPYNRNPGTGIFNVESVNHVVTLTADDGAAQTVFTFTIAVGANVAPTVQLPAAGSSFTGTVAAGFTMTVPPGAMPADAQLELVDPDGTIDVTAVVPAPSAPAGITAPAVSVNNPSGTLLTFAGTSAPALPGTYTFTITITDGVAVPVVFTAAITVQDVAPGHVAGTDASSGDGTAATPYLATVGLGGTPALNLSAVSDANTAQALTQVSVTPGGSNPTGKFSAAYTGTGAAGSVTITATGPVTIADVGDHTFTVEVTDGTNNVSIVARVNVQNTGNVAPVAAPGTGSTFSGTQAAGFNLAVNPGAALANATLSLTDVDGNSIEVTGVSVAPQAIVGITAPAASAPAAGPITLTWSGTADAAQAPGPFVYTVTMTDNVTAPVNFTVTITLVDVAPTHAAGPDADSGSGTSGSPYETLVPTGSVQGLALATVSDANTGQTLSLASVTPGTSNPSAGAGFTVTLSGGNLVATPDAALNNGDVGLHRFTATVSDGTNSTPVELLVRVVAPQEKPKEDDGCAAIGAAGWPAALLAPVLLAALRRRRK